MIPQIQEVNFPSYATLHQASATFVEMGERSISTQVRIDGDVVPSFAGWELRFKGERFVLPTVEPQAAKDTTTRNSLVDLTFESWIIQQLKRYYFFEPASIDTNTAIADKYVAPVRLSLSNFVALFNKVLKYYFGTSVQMSLFQGVGTDDPAIVEINYSYLWDVLGKMFEIYNVRWRIAYENSAYVIKVGYPADTINDHDFEYGYKGGLLRFERQVQDQDIRNILLGRGGEKNLPYRYFKKMDQQNTGWTPDPDAIPELANINFDRLRDVNFRWYVRGWMQNPLCDQAYAPYPTYDESQIPNDYKFAYLKGKTDDRFNPVEYVKDDDSIEKYGEHWGAVDNNDDIYPTIQGRSRSGLGRIDAVVDVSEIVTDDIEGASKAVSEVTNIGGVKSMSTSIASGQTASKSFTGETFAVKAGMTGVIHAMPFKEFGENETQDQMVTMSLSVEVINASTGQVATTASGETITTGSIPTGTYYLRVTALLENSSTIYDLEGTFGLNEVKLQSAGYDTEEWKPTFDIWVKNIWGTTQGSGETDLAYAERVWLPILGDRAGNEAKVVFSDGFMSVSSDYEFVIAAYPVPDRTKTILVDGVEVQSEWKITLRKSDAEFEATGLYIPNSTTGGKPVAGDHFFFIGIDMPFDYVLWGEEDVNTYKAAQLGKTAQVNPTWVINLDKVRVHTLEQGEYDTVLADRLAAGATVHIKDKRFTGGDVLTLYVQSMTYTWNEPSDDKPYIVPDIEVVLSDKVVSRTSVVEQIQGDVDVIRTQYAKIDDIEGVVRRVASPLFLKKTGESDKSLSPTQFAGKVSSDDFRQGDVGGAGWGAYTDGDGNAVYEVDKLVVRKELRVNNLVANQISYVGGKQINSAASIECVQVREESDGYVCYFDQKRGSIANLFVVGDYAMGQIFNPNDVEERYYRRRVNEVGENYIKLSKATGQVDGSGVPQVGDIIVQYGHESNTARQYAIVRDVIGGGYESMLMGLNSASAAGTEYYMSGRKSSLTGPRWFVGDTAGQHAEYYNGVLNITGRLSVSSQIEKSSGVYVGLSQYLNSLQDQIDGNIQSWAGDADPLPVEVEGSVDPSTANYPASAWTTDTDRLKHMGDIYVNNTTGQGWRYTRQANDGDFYWMRITDEELANALQRISALETSVAGLAYLKAATNQGTLVEGGLVLTSLIQLGQTVNNVFTVWAGINGILDQTLANPLKSIAAWYGGPMRDLEMEGSGSGSGSGVSYAKSLFRMDGSGYLAGGNITWDNVGAGSIPGVHWDGNSVTIDGNVKLASTSGDSVTELLALVQELSSFFQKVNIGTAANPVYAVKVRDEYAGLYSPGFLTAGGVGSGSGGGGGEIDLDRVWESLTNNTDKPNEKINIAHIPDITTSKVSDIETWIGNKGYLTSVAFSDLTSHPTTIEGYGITDAVDSARDLTDADDLLYVDPEEGVTVVIDDPGTTGTVLWGAESANQAALSVNGVSKLLVKYAAIEGINSSIGTILSYFTSGAANNALRLGGQLPSYYATAAGLSALSSVVDTKLSVAVTSLGGVTGAITLGAGLTMSGNELSVTGQTIGTVTSVAMSVPTGFSVSGSPITSSGTLQLAFESGYSLPTDTKQTQWDTAYSQAHTHSNKTYLDSITGNIGTAAYKGIATSIGSSITNLVSGALLYNVLGDSFDSTNTVKAFVNSSIATATATYRGSFNVVSDLSLTYDATHAQIEAALGTAVTTADDNDYAFVEIPVSGESGAPIGKTERYKYNGTSWSYEYALNNSGFTAAQWSAINSGITSSLVDKLNGIASGAQVNVIESVKVNGTALTVSSKAVDITAVPLSIITGAEDLQAIEALTGTTGLLKKTAANTWALDTTAYITAASLPLVFGTGTNSAKGLDSHVFASGNYSFAHGFVVDGDGNVSASGVASVALGYATMYSEIKGTSIAAFAQGYANDDATIQATNTGAFARGYASDSALISASASGALASGYAEEGGSITASGSGAIAFGYAVNDGSITASGYGSLAFGFVNDDSITAPGSGALAFGRACSALGDYALVHGMGCSAIGDKSTAQGGTCTAHGDSSFASGYNVYAMNDYEQAFGMYNYYREGVSNADTTIFSVGIGTANNARKNAIEIMRDGKVYLLGSGGYNGSSLSSVTDIGTLIGGMVLIGNSASYDTTDLIVVN